MDDTWQLTGRCEWRLFMHACSGWLAEEWKKGDLIEWRWKGDGPPPDEAPALPRERRK